VRQGYGTYSTKKRIWHHLVESCVFNSWASIKHIEGTIAIRCVGITAQIGTIGRIRRTIVAVHGTGNGSVSDLAHSETDSNDDAGDVEDDL
jgi:hypothetical protein